MGKSSIALRERAATYKSDGLIVADHTLFCKKCGVEVKPTKKQITQHLQTKKHRNKCISNISRATLTDILQNPTSSSNQYSRDLCEALASTNVPLHNLRHSKLGIFLLKYTGLKDQPELPVDIKSEEEYDETKNDDTEFVDETIDFSNRKSIPELVNKKQSSVVFQNYFKPYEKKILFQLMRSEPLLTKKSKLMQLLPKSEATELKTEAWQRILEKYNNHPKISNKKTESQLRQIFIDSKKVTRVRTKKVKQNNSQIAADADHIEVHGGGNDSDYSESFDNADDTNYTNDDVNSAEIYSDNAINEIDADAISSDKCAPTNASYENIADVVLHEIDINSAESSSEIGIDDGNSSQYSMTEEVETAAAATGSPKESTIVFSDHNHEFQNASISTLAFDNEYEVVRLTVDELTSPKSPSICSQPTNAIISDEVKSTSTAADCGNDHHDDHHHRNNSTDFQENENGIPKWSEAIVSACSTFNNVVAETHRMNMEAHELRMKCMEAKQRMYLAKMEYYQNKSSLKPSRK